MLSLELADALFRAAGDCHVLLVGDTDQLPPIGPGRVLADLVASDVVPRVHLTAIYRQAARSLIIQSARRINGGEQPFFSVDEARERARRRGRARRGLLLHLAERPAVDARRRCSTSSATGSRRAASIARTDVMTLVPMRRGPVGLVALNEELERRLNPGEKHSSSPPPACASARGSCRRRTTTRPTAR